MTKSKIVFVTWLAMAATPRIVLAVPAGSTPPAGVDEAKPGAEVKEAVRDVAKETKEAALSFTDDMRSLPRRVWEDVKGLPTILNGAALTIGGVLAAVSSEHWDDDVRGWTARRRRRFGAENDVLDVVASAYSVYGISAALYGVSLFADSPKLHAFTLDMLSSLSIELPVVFALKKAFDTRRPNGDSEGFPSGHAAASASLGALLNSYYGPWAGAAGAGFAALVAFHRIDDRKHDLSDVLFGAALGYVAGRTAADVDELPIVHAHLLPLAVDPPAPGLRLEWRF